MMAQSRGLPNEVDEVVGAILSPRVEAAVAVVG
jgi:hypothetical protein